MDAPQSPKYVAVRYVGSKPVKLDNVLHRNISWLGNGDVQFVPIEDALVYCRHKGVWEYARDVELPADGTPFPETPPGPALPVEARNVAETLAVEAEDVETIDPNLTHEQMAERVQEVIRAIAQLKKSDFSENGKPKLPALKAIIGRQVAAAERDAAWEHLSAALRDDQRAALPGG